MEEILEKLAAQFTPGAVGVWTLVIMALVGWWKGLPGVLDAFANRQSKIEERMQALLDRSTERFEREIAAADERHNDCIEGQRRLMERVDELEREAMVSRKIINEQAHIIEGLNHKITQMQISALRTEGIAPSSMIQSAMDTLSRLPD